jgi:nucleotide-binding universal stress UspA family protein
VRAETVELREGLHAVVRPVEPDDKARLADTVRRLSRESRYRRFFRPLDELRADELAYLTEIDHHDHEALVALDPATDEALGVARYVRLPTDPTRAEAAVAVVDDWHGRGLGRALLERLVDRAREEGIERFVALVQADNRRAIAVLSSLGPTDRAVIEGGEVELDIELPPREGIGAGLANVLRAAGASLFSTGRLSRRLAARARELYEGRPGPLPPGLPGGPIVVGTDGSQNAAVAVRCAAELGRRLGAELHIACAHRPRLRSREQAERALAEATQAARGGATAIHAREGPAAEALIELAEELGAQLIVVGDKGMTGASRFLLGSVPNKVSHHAPCNVLIARTGDDGRRRPPR